MKQNKLWQKLIKVTTIAILIVLVLNIYLLYSFSNSQAEENMVNEARNLTVNSDAVWDYITRNQAKIEYTSDGIYEYKGVHCAIAAVEVAKQVTFNTENSIRYVRPDARNVANEATPFEEDVYTMFLTNSSLTEYWEIINVTGSEYLAYLTPIYVETSCLDCHGEPVDEIDVSGYAKEGFEVGDVIGLTSIRISTTSYTDDVFYEILRETALFIFLITICVLAIYFFINRFVTRPLFALEKVTEQIGDGEYDVDMSDFADDDEVASLAGHIAKMANNLERVYEDLELTVEERTEQLTRANEDLAIQQVMLEQINKRLSEENEYKSEFLAVMSHELKTPLSSVVAFTDILLRSGDLERDKEESLLREIQFNSNVLLSLIKNILDMARMEAGKTELHYEIIDLTDIVGETFRIVKPLADKKWIELTKNIDGSVPLFLGDAEQIKRVFENLLGNAIKFTGEAGKINLLIDYLSDIEEIKIQVSDNGIGMEADRLPFIFDKFVQCDSSSKREKSGSGLGLALSKSIIEMHGGRIQVESEVAIGSVFTVFLPVKNQEDIVSSEFAKGDIGGNI